MSETFECGDNATLVAYLYDEAPPAERHAVEAHLRVCAVCAAELAALTSTSLQLAAWTPPEADLSFRIVSESRGASVLRPPRWWQQPLPAWAQVAAAAAIFAVGLALGSGVRQSVPEASPAPAVAQAPAVAPVSTVSRDDLARVEQRLRSEMARMREAAAPAPAASDGQVMARVRALIEESEQRQRRELALRTTEVVRDVEAQRQFDFARIQRAFGQFEGTAGAEFQRQRQELNNLIRVAQRPQ
jgi:hypothetical protein